MNIIFVGKLRGRPLRCQLQSTRQVFFCFSLFATIGVTLLGTGYWLGSQRATGNELVALERNIGEQKLLINQARLNAESEMDALVTRIGDMQANVIRLNALGERLVDLANIDAKEFDFSQVPAYGGAETDENTISVDFDNVISELNEQLSDRELQLDVLENILMNQQLKLASKPSGRPITAGWTSSYYGKRTDPFSGKLAMHKGMDFAGKEGSEIIAVADGVVTWSGSRYGYGNLVEINHGNGYTTRYGHNKELLVKVGDDVKKGQAISLMGSTGRSTGPHVHFEVLKNDRQINPASYVATK